MKASRRSFLGAVGATAAWAAMPRLALAEPAQGTLRLMRDHVVAQVPQNFTGLSYETAQLIHPDYLAASNSKLVALVRSLGREGVLRIGGNTSAFTTWEPSGEAAPFDATAYGPDRDNHDPHQVPGAYRITPHAIDRLNGFLQATGWQLIYGLNLLNGSLEAALAEATYVAKVCGPRLIALQFGNEPDLFRIDGSDAHRWTYEQYWPKWLAMYKAVHARLPHVPIMGPDTAGSKGWAEQFATDAKGMISTLTSHYYAEGPPTDPKMTIDYLLRPGDRLQTSVLSPLETAHAAGLKYRMSEGNSCYRGGKEGVSDTFGAALWAADFMLNLARRGTVGVNFHGGGNGMYAPIVGMQPNELAVHPDYYGILLGAQFAGTGMLDAQFEVGGANVTAYAAKHAHGVQAAIVNKSASDVAVTVADAPAGAARMWPLVAPALTSKTGVTFGGAGVSDAGVWRLSGGQATGQGALHVPAYSAVLVRWRA